MKIGFVSDTDPFHDRSSWSGTVYSLCHALSQAGNEVVWVPFDKHLDSVANRVQLRLLEWYMRLSGRLVVGTCYLDLFCRHYARAIERQGLYRECDCLFFAGPSGAQIARFLHHRVPYIYLADACYHLMENYYWFNLSPFFARRARRSEEIAVKHAWFNIRSSHWAAEGTLRHCQADSRHMHVLLFGANIDDHLIVPSTPYAPSTSQLRILFSGTDWERKGGDVAVETVRRLRQMGHEAELTIVGQRSLPPSCRNLPFVHLAGFLDKNRPDDYCRYLELWQHAHLFLLPTRAECSAIVFSEAAAYGVPVFSYDTGGTTDYVRPGINGHVLPLSDGPQQFADAIDCCLRTHQLPKLAAGARRLYTEALSWNQWSRHFSEILSTEVSLLS